MGAGGWTGWVGMGGGRVSMGVGWGELGGVLRIITLSIGFIDTDRLRVEVSGARVMGEERAAGRLLYRFYTWSQGLKCLDETKSF